MAFNLNNIRSEIDSRGWQKASHFIVRITPPASLPDPNGIFQSLPARINSTNIPGFNFVLDDVKHKGFGLTEKRPMNVQYEDINLTIIADAGGLVLGELIKWGELIMPTNDEDGSDKVEYLEFPENYYGTLEIEVYSMDGNLHTTYIMKDAFITNIGSSLHTWETVDSQMLISLSFAYRSYKRNSTFSGRI